MSIFAASFDELCSHAESEIAALKWAHTYPPGLLTFYTRKLILSKLSDASEQATLWITSTADFTVALNGTESLEDDVDIYDFLVSYTGVGNLPAITLPKLSRPYLTLLEDWESNDTATSIGWEIWIDWGDFSVV